MTKTHAKQSKFTLLVMTAALGSMLAPLNSTMIAVALPGIREAFDVSHSQVGWLITAYLITMAVAQPVGGRLADQIGRGPTFRFGLIAFLAFSLAAFAAPSFLALVFLRTGQALTGAVVIPSGMAMLRSASGEHRFGEAVGFLGAVIGLSAAAGPVIGGAILELGSWRLIFLMNIPLVVMALGFQALLGYKEEPASQRLSLDLRGALALAGVLVLITFFLSSTGAASVFELAIAGLALAVISAFFVRGQLGSKTPVAEWRLFKNRSFAAATGFILLSNMVMYTTLLSTPFFIKEVQGRGESAAGVLLASMSIFMALLAPMAGRFSDRHGRRLPTMIGGAAQIAAALVLLIGISEGASLIFLAASLALLGLGIGLGTGPSTTAAVEAAPRDSAGIAAGTVSMTRYFGSIVGAGILGSFLSQGDPTGVAVFRILFGGMIGIAVLATIFASQIHDFAANSGAEEQKQTVSTH